MLKKYLFDVSSSYTMSKIVVLPIPFDTTSSYRRASGGAPCSILQASIQLDLFDLDFGFSYISGVYMEKISLSLLKTNSYLSSLLSKKPVLRNSKCARKKINKLISANNYFTYHWTLSALSLKKIPVILGGEHSVVYGSIKACLQIYGADQFSILHFDAHADMRTSYENFYNSHASIIHNICYNNKMVRNVVQVGIRDISYNEYKKICLNRKIHSFFDKKIRRYKILGAFDVVVYSVVNKLKQNIYVTIDIDALNVCFCSNTGTPVPGGVTFDQIVLFIRSLRKARKNVIAMDICETSSSTLDSLISARLMYKVIGLVLSN